MYTMYFFKISTRLKKKSKYFSNVLGDMHRKSDHYTTGLSQWNERFTNRETNTRKCAHKGIVPAFLFQYMF